MCASTGLTRPRLVARLDELLNARLGVVAAPAGAGKTTLMTQWAKRASADVAWYRGNLGCGAEESAIPQLGEALATASPGRPPARDFDTLVAAIERHDSPLVLVVDDLQLVEHTPIGFLLHRLLLIAPPHFRLLVGSRKAPSFNLARSEIPTVWIAEEDLRFRASETAALFRDVYQRPLPSPTTEHLTHELQGWAAGLHLFQLSVPDQAPRERRSVRPSAQVQHVRDYLDREVLGSLPDELVTFLHRTSCMEVLMAGRCDSLLGLDTSRRMLAELEKRGAMVHSDDGGATYRVHVALRRHLERALHDELGRTEASELHRQAAQLLSEEEEYVEALRVLIRSGDWEAACAIVRQHWDVVASGSTSWVDEVTDQVLTSDPWMQLALARRHLDRGHPKAAGQLAAAAAASFATPEDRRRAQETCDAAKMWLGEQVPPSTGWVALLYRAASRDPAEMVKECAQTSSPEEEVGRALAYALAGNLSTARAMLRRSLDSLKNEPTYIAARLALSVLDAGTTPPSATLLVEQTMRDYPWFGLIAEVLSSVQEAIATGQSLDDGLLRESISDRDLHGDPWGALALSAIRAVAQLRIGHPDERGMEDLVVRSRGLGCATLEAWARAGLALVAAATAAPEATLEAQTAEAFARAAGVPGAAALAYAALAASDPERLGELLALAESTADEVGLTFRPWTWLPPPAAESEPLSGPPGVAPTATVVHEQPLVSVRCFGHFELRIRGEEPALGRVRPRAREVLRLLALHAGRPVHRELLVDALWPELDSLAGTHNLQVSVSNLRRVLEPGVPRGASRIVVRDGERYQLSLPDGSFSDLAEFDRVLAEADRARATGMSAVALKALSRAMDLYVGEVLPEDGSAEWVLGARERYRVRLAEAAATMAQLHLSRDEPAAAAAAALRSLDADPCRDASWRLLLSAYATSGDLAAAEQARRSYADVLTSLGVVSTSAAAVLPKQRDP